MRYRDRPRILIVGVNFAGLTAALRLPVRFRVEAVDRAADFEYLPHIHELVSRVKRPANLRLPRRRLLRGVGQRFLRDEVVELDGAAGTAVTASGRRLEFDHCLIAVGGVNDFYGVAGADRFAHPFKSVADCAAIGERLKRLMGRRRQVSVVIVGGGLEGVECLGEVLRRYRQRDELTIHLVERGRRLLPAAPAALDREVRRLAEPYAVRFHTGVGVAAVAEREVRLDSGASLASELTIWTGGAAAPGTLAAWGLAERPGEWAPVRDTLESALCDGVLLAGDAAELAEPIDKQGYYAIQMGEHAAEGLRRLARGRRPRRFRASKRPTLIAFGDLTTFLVLGRTVVAGPALGALKEAVFQATMARFDPPFGPAPFFALQERLWTSFGELALPMLLSPAAALRLGGVRLLDC